jgi:hypothetical protein
MPCLLSNTFSDTPCRTILAGHSKRMKDAMFKDEVASKLKKGIVCSSMLLVASIEEGLVSTDRSERK